ncbi:uncharacterized protein LOC111298556 [Durio zibethinus]|uniref:Uncharacterized protein LOC111298556 n=1 Tax=Durio zibethinus TaxID=66656 RepID=A0A6P5Z906_DURZI|nr:uncharacterized protein LOC111298556 [Durio zibethinus]
MSILAPYQILELNLISAQDLEPVCRRKMRTYAVAWVHRERKLSTRIDTQGHTNPTWNDKFIFRIDDEFLYGETSAVMIELYAVHWFRDIQLGTVRAIIGNLFPSISRPRHRHEVQLGMRFEVLQVRRPSGRPQGILNIGVALLDSSKRSMPLYLQMGSSAVGYQYLMGEEDPFQSSKNNPPSSTKTNKNDHQLLLNGLIKPELRRTKSDSSSIFGSDLWPRRPIKGSSIINGGSAVNGSEIGKNNYGSNSTGSSMANYKFEKSNKKGKPSSIINGSDDPARKGPEIVEVSAEKGNNGPKTRLKTPPGKSPAGLRCKGSDYGAPKKKGGSTIWNDSEMSPSPSEVSAAVVKNMYLNRIEETESSLVGGWSLDESNEGLRSKLERWRTELPPVYDRGSEISSHVSSGNTTTTKKPRHVRRHTETGGVFSCFGNICGCEISISCGPGGGGVAARKKGNLHRNLSVDDLSFL